MATLTAEKTSEGDSEDPAIQVGGHKPPSFWILTLGSIGVVYGDIGTSPLYAVREAVLAATNKTGPVTEPVVLGVLSLIIWALILVVTVKYVGILLNADNKGEGGTLSLMALAQRVMGNKMILIPVLAMIGAALFYGDAMITPAISVLSAVEGLKIVTPAFDPYVLPITLAIIIGLFAVQARGTASVAALFGPVTLVWFAAIALAGIAHIGDNPAILFSFNPVHAVSFLSSHGVIGLVTLGAVFLAVTGAEALYADLGHFGKRPIQLAWIAIVLPALLLNYLGQGALILKEPATLENPFFLMMPGWALIPIVALATAATIIASQAVITGAYSLTRQAIQLGLLAAHGNSLHFGSPCRTDLHAAGELAHHVWRACPCDHVQVFVRPRLGLWHRGDGHHGGDLHDGHIRNLEILEMAALGCTCHDASLLAIDIIFLGANSLKVFEGGYVPLALGMLLMLIMWTWRRGSQILFAKTRKSEVPLVDLVRSLSKRPPHCVPGTAVFFTSDPESTPTALLHSLKHYKVLHENNVVLTIRTSDSPSVAPEDRVKIEKLNDLFSRLIISYGYMETPDVPKALGLARKLGWKFNIMTTSFFLSRRSVRASKHEGMPVWQDKLFIGLARNANDASSYFRLPTDRVVEVGSQITV